MNLNKLNIAEAKLGLRSKKFSSEELTLDCFKRIEERDREVGAFVTLLKDEALLSAKNVDVKIAKGEGLKSLEGIPCSLKDLFNVKGVRATAGSKILENYIAPFDATVVSKLKDQGMVLMGKVNMDEFACGASTEHSGIQVTRNPIDLGKIPGGSSGGSAASVVDDMCLYSLGTDTGGSIRQPASLTGCVGLKVTYGRVSRSGVTAMASSWDTVGPLTKTVKDAAIVLREIAGFDEKDSTTPKIEVPDYEAVVGKSIKGLKIGVPKEFFAEGIEKETSDLVKSAIEELGRQGAEIKEVELPMAKYGVAVYYVSSPAEVSANMARYDGLRYGSISDKEAKDLLDFYEQNRSDGFGDEMKRRIMMGSYVLSAGYYDAYYKKAQQVRTLIIEDFNRVFEEVDVLAGPVSPFPAWDIGGKINDPLAMYLADILTIPASAAGIPSISVPCGNSKEGLPVGLQIMGPQFGEEKVLQVAGKWEEVRG